METPPPGITSKQKIINYYVKTLEGVFGSEKEAQMCIYHASCDTHFGFCCDIDEEASCKLAGLPGVLFVRPDPDFDSMNKDYSSKHSSDQLSNSHMQSSNYLFPTRNSKYWLVRMDKPTVEVVTKAQMVDYYVHILIKVLGNEKDAQMCIYHISWQLNYGFCCELDEECARELAGVPGVLSVQPDENFASENKDYGGIFERLVSTFLSLYILVNRHTQCMWMKDHVFTSLPLINPMKKVVNICMNTCRRKACSIEN